MLYEKCQVELQFSIEMSMEQKNLKEKRKKEIEWQKVIKTKHIKEKEK